MRLFTYFESLPSLEIENNLRLVNAWRKHHQALGYTPIVLQEWHARAHPYFREMDAAISKLPSVNPEGYDRACYLRWLAMAKAGGGMMADIDCFLYVTPMQLQLTIEPVRESLAVFQGYVPCLVRGQESHYLEQCKRFADYTATEEDRVNGRPHTSDMCILAVQATKEPDSFKRLDVVKHYAEAGWETAPGLHFSNACMTPKNLIPRWKHIPTLRQIKP